MRTRSQITRPNERNPERVWSRSFVVAAAMLVSMTLLSPSAHALLHDCAAPTDDQGKITAVQCLFILNAAVGTATCPAPACSCDPNGDCKITATDALQCLRAALGLPGILACPSPCGEIVEPASCDQIELIVRSGSDLDAGWKGTGHDAELLDGASVRFEIVSRCSDDESVCEIDADCTGGSCEASCDCGDTDTECEISGPTGPSACVGDTSLACNTNADCSGSICANFFGPPLPLAASGVPVCVTTYFARPFTGTLDLSAGDFLADAALRSRVHLGINIETPCPRCGGQESTVGDSATCVGGPHDGSACIVEAVSSEFGGVSSHCPPDRAANVSGVGLNIQIDDLTTGVATNTAGLSCGPPFDEFHPTTDSGVCLDDFSACKTNDDCAAANCGLYCHCGFCDDGGGGDPDLPCMSDSQCPPGSACRSDPIDSRLSQAQPNACASLICGEVIEEQCCSELDGDACKNPTSLIGTCNGNPNSCSTNAECASGGNGDECILEPAPCFADTITRNGSPFPVGDECSVQTSEPVIAGLFCIPATSSPGVNSASGLPGPAAVALNATLVFCRCGDGVIACAEECDDANQNNGDGCDSACRLEL